MRPILRCVRRSTPLVPHAGRPIARSSARSSAQSRRADLLRSPLAALLSATLLSLFGACADGPPGGPKADAGGGLVDAIDDGVTPDTAASVDGHADGAVMHSDGAGADGQGQPCATVEDCPTAAGPCLQALCHPKLGCLEQALPDDVLCDDDDACTLSATCVAGQCIAGPQKVCDDGAACTTNGCDPKTGECTFTATPKAACDDGNPCTHDEQCTDEGKCAGGEAVCACADDADCAAKNDGNPCTGTLYCDAASKTCAINAASVVTCSSTKDTACSRNLCDPASGACAMKALPDGTLCEDGAKCTVNDSCEAGTCQAGKQVCCKIDKDCAGFEDDNLCNGTLYCDQAKGLCLLNPSTLVTCPSVYDTACRKNACDPKKGACGMVAVQDGEVCTDGNACTPNDLCKGGECTSKTNVCKCTKNADCVSFEDGNPCNGTLFCHLGASTPTCVVNPATVIFCSEKDDDACRERRCDPKSGKCNLVPLKDKKPCDGDGNACTPNDACLNGVCKVDANVCPCQTDAECVAKEDGNVCNGTLYCDKSSHVCKVNPATVVTCPSVNDTACLKNRCEPKTGQCAQAAEPNFQTCDADGTPCTLYDACIGGKCVAGKNLCQCKTGAHCDLFEDGDKCNGSLFCDKAQQPWACAPNPASAVYCEKSKDGDCVRNLCDAKTGGCDMTPIDQGKLCDDGDLCLLKGACDQGTCVGKARVCDDVDPCTNDSCDPLKGCVYLPIAATVCDDGNTCTGDKCAKEKGGDGCYHTILALGATCQDGSACTKGDTCKSGTCEAGAVVNCDDGNPCSVDGCNKKKGCVHNPVQDDKSCDDGDACTSEGACKSGKCEAKAKVCDDGKPCTTDACDIKSGGACVHQAKAAGKGCDDGDACTWADSCDASGGCSGKPKDCDDGKICTTDSCDKDKGGCVATPNDSACDDGDPCSKGDVCGGGVCLAGEATLCNDDNACTTDSCVKGKGCSHSPTTKPCSDGSFCTTDDACDAKGNCTGKAKSCDDGKVCTDDGCVAELGCVNSANSAKCVDGNSCTTDDRCKGGGCAGKPVACGDGNPCTDDACDQKQGCTHQANVAVCDDGNPCTTGEACKAGTCQGGAATVCDDKNPCTTDACKVNTGCVSAPSNGGSCDDGDLCTAKTVCQNGKCLGGTKTDCDDKNACTSDGCDSTGKGCVHNKQLGACDDGDKCTTGDLCGDGVCLPGEASPCNDGNPCTTDGCDKAKGCTHGAGVGVCNDGDLCTQKDACKDGGCVGVKRSCDDSNPCTTDSCDSKVGCVNKPATSACIDGDSCTTKDKCINGTCVGQKVACGDGDPCTDDSCDSKKGCVHAANKAGCDDGNACTEGDVCSNGSCTAGKSKSCDDGNPCTTGTCDASFGCKQAGKSGSCTDGNPCTTGDTCKGGACFGQAASCDDSNACTDDSCNASTGKCVYQANKASCNDGSACTSGESCSAGKCAGGSNITCDDGNLCTDDACSSTLGCVVVNNTKGCDDGDLCTVSDTCGSGSCAGTAKSCDDGDLCRVGSCDPSTGSCVSKPGNEGAVCGGGGHWCHAGVCKWATSIATGLYHTCVTHGNGGVSCWGANTYGQTGLGTKTPGSLGKPHLLTTLGTHKAVEIALSETGSCARTSADDVVCWGRNDNGELAAGSGSPVFTPTAVQGAGGKLRSVSGGRTWLCSLRADKRVVCWGRDSVGSLGRGPSPSVGMGAVFTVKDITHVRAGDQLNVAFAADGNVWAWGNNYHGALGIGSSPETRYVRSPILVPPAKGAIDWVNGGGTGCFLYADGGVRCAGDSGNGQLGLGYVFTTIPVFTRMTSLPPIEQMCGGMEHLCALTKSGDVYCWGRNASAEAAPGKKIQSVPYKVKLNTPMAQVSCGRATSCALSRLGEVWCWGANSKGEMGNGTVSTGTNAGAEFAPARVVGSDAVATEACKLAGKCDDGKPCTADVCDPKTGKCSHPAAAAGTPCANDGVCSAGACKVGFATDIAAGSHHACVLRGDAGVDCWGDDSSGQRGDGVPGKGAPLLKKSSVSGLVEVTTLRAGGGLTCARQGARLSCWGDNTSHQAGRGDGLGAKLATAAKVTVIDGVIDHSVGGQHVCAVKESGSVWCWGAGKDGQLGDGAGSDSAKAVMVKGLDGVTAVVSGASHSCALLGGGKVQCWGRGADGQLGHGSAGSGVHAKSPVSVLGISNVVALAAGGAHTCAIRGSGSVVCWGRNADGETGTGATSSSTKVPATVAGVTEVSALALGAHHTCAANAAGKTWCWGRNTAGQVGKTAGGAVLSPTVVSAAGATVQLACGQQFSCALRGDGSTRCWGAGGVGQLGGASASSVAPVVVPGTTPGPDKCGGKTCDDGDPCTTDRCDPFSGVCRSIPKADGATCGHQRVCVSAACKPAFARSLASGKGHSCVVGYDGATYCWGANTAKESSDSVQKLLTKPTLQKHALGADMLALGDRFSCAVDSDAKTRCWGRAATYETGRGKNHSASPTAQPLSVSLDVRQIAAGDASACAVDKAGALWCWGANDAGQLGDGTTIDRSGPTKLQSLSAVTQVSVGKTHACAVHSDGKVSCWGANSSGQLGDGTLTSRSTPGSVAGVGSALAVSVGGNFSCASLRNGRVRCWGEGAQGQLGQGAKQASKVAVDVAAVGGVVSIASGSAHTCVATASGAVQCWGTNRYGAMGGGVAVDAISATAIHVPGLVGVAQVSASANFTCARSRDGSVRCLGSRVGGALGDGASGGATATPAVVIGSAGVVDLCAKNKVVCDDKNPCTLDRCVPTTGLCVATPSPDGQPCGGQRHCAAGACRWAVDLTLGKSRACVVRASGAVNCWGRKGEALGPAGVASDRNAPVEVPLAAADDVASGGDHVCARLKTGRFRCWGYGANGTLGTGATAASATPRVPAGMETAAAVFAGENVSLVLRADGQLWGFGGNQYTGQLLAGGAKTLFWPHRLTAAPANIATVVQSAGSSSGVITKAGELFLWGANKYGEVGTGQQTTREDTPKKVPLSDVTSASCGRITCCAVHGGGKLSCWGGSQFGETASGSTSPTSQPKVAEVAGVTDMKQVGMGFYGGCGVHKDGTVSCWGRNQSGTCGVGATSNFVLKPQKVSGLKGVEVVRRGMEFACALKTDGSVWCWGLNKYGQLGIGEHSYNDKRTTPVAVVGSTP